MFPLTVTSVMYMYPSGATEQLQMHKICRLHGLHWLNSAVVSILSPCPYKPQLELDTESQRSVILLWVTAVLVYIAQITTVLSRHQLAWLGIAVVEQCQVYVCYVWPFHQCLVFYCTLCFIIRMGSVRSSHMIKLLLSCKLFKFSRLLHCQIWPTQSEHDVRCHMLHFYEVEIVVHIQCCACNKHFKHISIIPLKLM